ncbi:MAG: cysteine hydrolase [Clostridiaceae bacterium]|jgi:nicotinamidase-related amidase|nr:cysteine hydrolase [Clostridiaceae bacterium]
MSKFLIVIDMQNDFIDGALGTPEAVTIVPNVAEKIRSFKGDGIIFTLDTHGADYLDTAEGKGLPVPHCIRGTTGHSLPSAIDTLATRKGNKKIILKDAFGTFEWKNTDIRDGDDLEICGLCTDICIIANAVILRTMFPNSAIRADASCCAGVTPQKHLAALEVMRSLQIDVVND